MNKEYEENKRILYKIHEYDPRDRTKNIHHIIFRSNNGTNEFSNLSLLDIELHDWIHKLLDNIEKNN
jgi:hypothetical protein